MVFDSKKNKIIFFTGIILCILALVVAGVSFSIYFSNMGNKKGFEVIDYVSTSKYNNNVSLTYYLDDSDGMSIPSKTKLIQNYYSAAIIDFYTAADEYTPIDGYVNLGYINTHPNEEIVIYDFLYDALYDAYEKTISEDSNYSLFSGYLNYFWFNNYQNYDLANIVEYDPLFNDTENEKLLLYTDIAKNRNLVDLEFYPDNKIKLVVDESLINLEEKLYLDFNYLKDAYALEYIASQLIENNFTKGYLTSQTGLSIKLGEIPSSIEYSYYLNELGDGFKYTLNKKYRIANLTTFKFNNAYGYSVEKDSRVYERYFYFDFNMVDSLSIINSIQGSSCDKFLYDLVFETHQILINTSKNDIKNKIKNSSTTFILSDRSNICYTNNFDNNISYNLKNCTLKGVDLFEE